jgi:hypothetical protein
LEERRKINEIVENIPIHLFADTSACLTAASLRLLYLPFQEISENTA